MRQSLGLSWEVHRKVDLVLMLHHSFGLPYGLDYATEDGEKMLWGFSLSLGARVWWWSNKKERR